MIIRMKTQNAMLSVAAAALVAAPASADLNFFWTYDASGGNITNTLNFISDTDSFTASLFAQTLPASPFVGVSGDLMPDAGSQTYFAGGFELGEAGYEDPILAGKASGAGAASISGGTIDAVWISNWPENSFPTGTTADPVFGGQFTVANTADGEYTFRLNNADGVEVLFTGDIIDGRFQQRLPGDANMDNVVNLTDFVAWRTTFLASPQPSEISVINGDFTGDGIVNLTDFVTWRNTFLNPPASNPSASVASVPEPGSMAVLGLASALLLRRRRNVNI